MAQKKCSHCQIFFAVPCELCQNDTSCFSCAVVIALHGGCVPCDCIESATDTTESESLTATLSSSETEEEWSASDSD